MATNKVQWQEERDSCVRKNPSQEEAWKVLETCEISVLIGAAGTGKTHLAMSYGVQEVRKHNFKRIVVIRAILESGRSRLGFLPGAVGDKIAPYMRPALEVMRRVRATDITVECLPPCHIQGLTIDDAYIVVDEAQNLTIDEIKLIVGRTGRHSRIVFTGDPSQDKMQSQGALETLVRKCEGVEGFGVHRFSKSDIVRHAMIGRILTALES